ncbi:hypothetical protein ED479_15275 [Salmonella enterica subsp. enterica serovar Typhimurium]|nr:hypothetical protein [Salmonella enterica subsp. enterica serovar Typhimurium]
MHTNLKIFIRPISNTSGQAVESCFYFAPVLHNKAIISFIFAIDTAYNPRPLIIFLPIVLEAL